MPSKLLISDTTVTVTEPANSGDSCEWNGECVLSGNATVTYISQNDYSPLKIGCEIRRPDALYDSQGQGGAALLASEP